MRTSLTHPLQIAEISAGEGFGKVGLTFCPGKKQPDALTGTWDRDLGLDLGMIAAWNAAAVVTLVEAHELDLLKVPNLGDAVRDRHMVWYHLPIRDYAVPTDLFEADWQRVGAQLRAILSDDFNVLVHCKGGLGRAGTIASRLLVELGVEPVAAAAQIRAVRPGAIETTAQYAYVMGLQPLAEIAPARSTEAQRDRATGALLGLAVGDALGTTLEFKPRDSCSRLADIVGGGPFRLQPGEWTDDTAMALALADSLLAYPNLNEADLMTRFVAWLETGAYSCTGTCFDIGNITHGALRRWQEIGDPLCGSTDPTTAGNGSLMRLAPAAIGLWRSREILRDVAARQSRVTHATPEAVEACIVFSEILADAIEGYSRAEVMRSRTYPDAAAIAEIMAGSWRGKPRSAVRSSGYVVHSLEAALWCFGRTGCFEDAVLLAANLGDDADTTAAIAGQLAGAFYGASGIPAHWLDRLAWRSQIEATAGELFDLSTSAGGRAR